MALRTEWCRGIQKSYLNNIYILLLCSLSLATALGGYAKLSYHEAFVAQGAREILTSDNWAYPSIGGRPWLEKPPLPFWLVAFLGQCSGTIRADIARAPSCVAATLLVLAASQLATRHYGALVGLFTGAIQATTAWTVIRGRLAEADILLVCLMTWALLAFDHIRPRRHTETHGLDPKANKSWHTWRWTFFLLLGLTSLVKGIAFGAVLILAVIAITLAWDRDYTTLLRLRFLPGWLVVSLLSLGWPALMIIEHGTQALDLWLLHSVHRLRLGTGHGPFAGEPWLGYIAGVLGQGLPWTPFALFGVGKIWAGHPVCHHLATGCEQPDNSWIKSEDRFFWIWSAVPLLLVSLPRTRNAHYAIYAMVPWSIWSALAVEHLLNRLNRRGFAKTYLARGFLAFVTGLACIYGVTFWRISPQFDHRGVEWAFYEKMGQKLRKDELVTVLYDDWDRQPYPTPFGPIPHDIGVRLFYLDHPVCWHFDLTSVIGLHHRHCLGSVLGSKDDSLLVLGRSRSLSLLDAAGRLEWLDHGPAIRWDRTYSLVRFWPDPSMHPRFASAPKLVRPK